MTWLLENWPVVLGSFAGVALALKMAVAAIAPLTETKLDDKLAKVFSKLYSILSYLSPKR